MHQWLWNLAGKITSQQYCHVQNVTLTGGNVEMGPSKCFKWFTARKSVKCEVPGHDTTTQVKYDVKQYTVGPNIDTKFFKFNQSTCGGVVRSSCQICRQDCWWRHCRRPGFDRQQKRGAVRWRRDTTMTRPACEYTHLTTTSIDRLVTLRPTQHKTGHFEDVSPSQCLGLVWKKLNLAQQKQAFTSQKKCTTTQHKHKN